MGTEEGASKLAEAVKATFGQLDYAVTSSGAWWQKGACIKHDCSMRACSARCVAHVMLGSADL